MLLDPLGPLAIRARYLPRLAPWLWRFWRAGTPSRVEAAARALGGLVGRAWTDWDAVIAEARIDDLVTRNGALFVYESAAGLRAADAEWDLRRRHGVRAETLDAAAIRRSSRRWRRASVTAISFPTGATSRIPTASPRASPITCARAAVTFKLPKYATSPLPTAGRRRSSRLPARPSRSTSWSFAPGLGRGRLCRMLGHDVPLDTERGYNTTLPAAPVCA